MEQVTNNMQNILFWVGYHARPWDGNTTTGLGGTEHAVLNIAEGLTRYGLNVTIAGHVKNSNVNGVEYIDIDNFTSKYSKLPNYFNVTVGVNYLNFLKYTKDANQINADRYFWMHNTDYYSWYKGEEMPNHLKLLREEVDVVLSPSMWSTRHIHREYFSQVKTPPHQIYVPMPNGIKPDSFNMNVPKDPNKFIWSSAVDRGLSQLLDHWKDIKEVKPNATLDVYYPKYADPHQEGWYNIDGILDKLEENKDLGVTDMGSVSQLELHTAMQKATYWMYLTHYEETFCITAIEMMAAGVLPICTNVAALKEVVDSGIILDKAPYETLFKDAIKLLKQLDTGLKDKAIESGKKTTKLRTWNAVASKWYELITTYKKPA